MRKPSLRFVVCVYAIEMCLVVNLYMLLWPYRSAAWFVLLLGGFVLASQSVADYLTFPPSTRPQAKTPITAKGVAVGAGVGVLIPFATLGVFLCLLYLLGPTASIVFDVISSIGRVGQILLANVVAACLGSLFGMVKLRQMRKMGPPPPEAVR